MNSAIMYGDLADGWQLQPKTGAFRLDYSTTTFIDANYANDSLRKCKIPSSLANTYTAVKENTANSDTNTNLKCISFYAFEKI